MFTLKNDSLYVSVLDPVADRGRLGSRYCTGCYIWQVTDMRLGELLSGPAYPDPAPPVFDGQGAPDAFERALGHESARVGDEVLVIGVGKVLRSSGITPFHSRHNPQVTCFCEWNIIQGSDSITMRTSQEFGEWSFNIIRSLILKDRILRLVSMIESSGNTEIPIRWFAHPFFPHTESMRCCSFSLPVKLPGNPGFMLDSEGFVNMKKEYDWKRGCFTPFEMEWGKPLRALQLHPLLGRGIEVSCEFPVAWMPIWGNANTVSFEQFFETTVKPHQTASWTIEYRF